MMVDADAYNGTYTKNNFNFKNYNTTFLGLTVNGEHLPGKPFQLKFAAAGGTNYVSAYQTRTLGPTRCFRIKAIALPETSMLMGIQCMFFI